MIKKDYDRLGSVRFMTDETGAIIQEYIYDAFGNLLSSSGSISQPYQYVGREGYYREGDIGLYLLGQRWYDAEVGRFVSRDLIGHRILNLYFYCRNNPLNYIDAEGRIFVEISIPATTYLSRCLIIARQILNRYQSIEDNHLRHCIASCKLAEETDKFCS